jgi:hypothetical protein
MITISYRFMVKYAAKLCWNTRKTFFYVRYFQRILSINKLFEIMRGFIKQNNMNKNKIVSRKNISSCIVNYLFTNWHIHTSSSIWLISLVTCLFILWCSVLTILGIIYSIRSLRWKANSMTCQIYNLIRPWTWQKNIPKNSYSSFYRTLCSLLSDNGFSSAMSPHESKPGNIISSLSC